MRSLALALLPLLLSGLPARAEVHEVKMLNRNASGGMVYEPDFLRLRPGDRVRFIATHATHNAATIPAMLPPGATPFRGRIDEEIEVAFTVPGTYGIQCVPHYAMGMVMLVQVGDGPVEEAALPDALPPRARQRLGEIIARARGG
ncbi:pseudoazurin [Teichococcus cervicalis]|uniref:Pseudoazurin n=1 Tax=Pseudoroseomonas cervicalis ATCC 49957 TaxID=525371 RepID=D5RJ54_9PROT|nr:pseudoazurin [Pseudoroseomonas cervicalis]EFH12671.1 pseudoazurin [Pseudoroseomonas cervicalis ATCC 49957]